MNTSQQPTIAASRMPHQPSAAVGGELSGLILSALGLLTFVFAFLLLSFSL